MRVSWTARRSNQSILKEISPECSLGGLKLKLKPQNLGHLMRRTDSFEKTPMLGKIEGGRSQEYLELEAENQSLKEDNERINLMWDELQDLKKRQDLWDNIGE